MRDLSILRRGWLKNEISSILSSAHVRIRVILAGKREGRPHSTSGFSENVTEVTETSYEMLKVLLFSMGRKLIIISIMRQIGCYLLQWNNSVNFSGEKSNMRLSQIAPMFWAYVKKL